MKFFTYEIYTFKESFAVFISEINNDENLEFWEEEYHYNLEGKEDEEVEISESEDAHLAQKKMLFD